LRDCERSAEYAIARLVAAALAAFVVLAGALAAASDGVAPTVTRAASTSPPTQKPVFLITIAFPNLGV
jgi:hypothetical protein